ncbi:hypothetical protein PG993_000881 [Apiospora rasikravindrae]|uniref:Uncharacterized protein n=1 Tax=Apiospora rasikravindrae TaxID=990691 RepID=A0ABR1UCL8_9PEZI
MPFWSSLWPSFWPFSRRDALPSKKRPLKQRPGQQTERESPIPSWQRHPFTRLRWLRQRIRAERFDYDCDQTLSIDSPQREPTFVDEPSHGLERPSFVTLPRRYIFFRFLVNNFAEFPRQRSLREILNNKGFEVRDLLNRRRPPPRSGGPQAHSSPAVEEHGLSLSDALEKTVSHFVWAIGWYQDWLLYAGFDWYVKTILWHSAQFIRRIFPFWAQGTMAWKIECYAMHPVPGTAMAQRYDGGVRERDPQLGPVVDELKRAQKVIERALLYKGFGLDSVKCSVGDLARLSGSLYKISRMLSGFYMGMARKMLLKQLGEVWGVS